VRLLTEATLPDGSTQKYYNTVRFVTSFANIKAISSHQGYSEGVSEKDTYYLISYAYQADRAINISDRILWGDKILKPVGDCIITDFGDKRVYQQKAKYSA